MRNILNIGKLSKKLLLVLLTMLLTSLALADEAIDTTKTGSLTIENRKKFE